MIEFLGQLAGNSWPTALTSVPSVRFLVTFALWACLGLLIEALLYVVRRVGRWHQSEIEQVLCVDVRAPLWAAIVLLALRDAVSAWLVDPTSQAYSFARPIALIVRAGLIISFVWLAHRIARDLLRYGAESFTTATETMVDDMLLPIGRTLLLPAAITVGAVLVLEAFGLPVQSIALLVGGASFILAFALRSTLEDVFGGVSLLVDTPFSYGDVVRLEDGTIAEVVGLGMRVTRLYDASEHAVIIMPNRKLVAQKMVNMSRPTPDFRMTISVTVPNGSSEAIVRRRLMDAALAHAYLLGPVEQKQAAMRDRLDRMVLRGDYDRASQQIREVLRVRAEAEVNRALDSLARHLIRFSGQAHQWERNGLADAEKDLARASLLTLRNVATDIQWSVTKWLLCVRYCYVKGDRPSDLAGWRDALEADLERLMSGRDVVSPDVQTALRTLTDKHFAPFFQRADEYESFVSSWEPGDTPSASSGSMVNLIGAGRDVDGYFAFLQLEDELSKHGFPAGLGDASSRGIVDLDYVEEYVDFVRDWNRKTTALLKRVEGIEHEFRSGSGVLLDEKLYNLRLWIEADYKDGLPRWKLPSVSTVNAADDITYELKAYVDNVKLSHYTRISKATKQVRRDIVDLFAHYDPPIPMARPSVDVALHGTAWCEASVTDSSMASRRLDDRPGRTSLR